MSETAKICKIFNIFKSLEIHIHTYMYKDMYVYKYKSQNMQIYTCNKIKPMNKEINEIKPIKWCVQFNGLDQKCMSVCLRLNNNTEGWFSGSTSATFQQLTPFHLSHPNIPVLSPTR